MAKSFAILAQASQAGIGYKESKTLFKNLDPHQVETKKAAFQEFGLLYVRRGSNQISLTPAGNQVFEIYKDAKQLEQNRRILFLTLARCLARYQFNNPFPVGGSSAAALSRASSTDVLPYLASYYLMHRLGGVITAQELRGVVFGLTLMKDIGAVEKKIKIQRKAKTLFNDLPGLPANKKTAENLKIYFMSHLGLSNSIIQPANRPDLYDGQDQAFELTQLGFEITKVILDSEWPKWVTGHALIPHAAQFASIENYFSTGVGSPCPNAVIVEDSKQGEKSYQAVQQLGIDLETIDAIKELPHKEYEEGKERLIQHSRIERRRNPTLVRDAKKSFIKQHGLLFCEICMFDFGKKYGERGKEFIEAHHKNPISKLDPDQPVKLKVEDLAMVCSNCHRMLHRPPWITVDELKAMLKS